MKALPIADCQFPIKPVRHSHSVIAVELSSEEKQTAIGNWKLAIGNWQ